MKMGVCVVSVLWSLAVLAGVTEEWSFDPLCWTRTPEGLQSGGTGFAVSRSPLGRDVTVSARVKPVACKHDDWATLGVSVFADSRNFWHLAFVKRPAAMQARRSYELALMDEGHWPNQSKLRRLESREVAAWEFGREYRLKLTLNGNGVRGEVVEADTGRLVYVAAYAFSKPCANFGRPALHVTGNLQGILGDLRQSVADPLADTSSEAVIPYPRRDVAPIAPATGFFRVMEHDGRWTAVDPHGAPFTVLGVDHVQPHGMFCESWGYSPYGRHVKKAYPNLDDWRDETLNRLKTWGFNALGAGCDFARLGHRGLVHTVFLSLGTRLCWIDGSDFWIRQCLSAPCTAFPNVFHPDFAAACDWMAEQKCRPAKNDPWLFGYFIDNELAWWGKGGLANGMFDTVKALPTTHSARRALEAFVAGRPVNDALKRDFLALVADRYFSVTTAAIRKVDPNHMVLGCRFAGLGGAHDVVWEAAARYCDLVTFNIYPWADIDRNVVLDRKGGVPVVKRFDDLYAKVKKPMIVTEWSFPALDTGRPCLHGAGQRFPTQEGRVRATELFAKTMLALPYFVGYDYFMWVDQPAPGMNSKFPEDSNYGLVMEDGTPHRGITEMFTRLQAETERWKKAGLPRRRDVVDPPVVSERERFLSAAKGNPDAVAFVRSGAEWKVTNDVGLVLQGVCGDGKDLVSSVSLDGRRLGSLGGLLHFDAENGQAWMDARQAASVSFRREGVCGTVLLTGEGIHRDRRFSLTLRVTVAPGRREFVADLVSVRNLGKEAIPVKAFFLRPFADGKPTVVPRVPNLWKESAEAFWRLSDGAAYGAKSADDTVGSLRLWEDGEGRQHPDVIFLLPQAGDLQPGEEFRPSRTCSARLSPMAKVDVSAADRAAAGKIVQVGIPWHFPYNRVDWLFNPTTAKPPFNPEWTWQLNRMGFWNCMAEAYEQTRDEKYARAFARQLEDWLDQTGGVPPEKDFQGVGSPWRTIEEGLRLMGSWPVAYAAFRDSPAFTPALQERFLASMRAQAKHLMAHRTARNWLLMEMNGVYTFASRFPQFPESEGFRKASAAILSDELRSQVLPDGLHYELSPDYHSVFYSCASSMYRLASETGFADELPADFVKALEAGADGFLKMMTPAFVQPRFNDCFTVHTSVIMSFAAKAFPSRSDFLWAVTRGQKGHPPEGETASRFLPWSGFAVMRSGWTPDATYLCFDVGPLGMGHYHQDKLSFTLWKGGEELVFDDGGGQYERSAFRTYGLSGYDHNVLSVDGLVQNRRAPLLEKEPIDAGWVSTPTRDAAHGTYDQGFGPEQLRLATQTREIVFDKASDSFRVTDDVRSADGRDHDYALLFQVDTTNVTVAADGRSLLARYGRTWDLELTVEEGGALSLQSGVRSPRLAGWFVGRNDLSVHPATTITVKAPKARDMRFVTTLKPVRAVQKAER